MTSTFKIDMSHSYKVLELDSVSTATDVGVSSLDVLKYTEIHSHSLKITLLLLKIKLTMIIFNCQQC